MVKDEFLPGDVRARRPGRGARHRRLLPLDGLQLQPRAPAAGGRRARRADAGSSYAARRWTTCWPPTWELTMMTDRRLKVAVLGCGSVGSQVVRLLQEQAGDLAARVGAPVELVGVAVRRLDAPREVDVPEGLLTTDAAGAGRPRRRRPRHRGDRRHRAGPRADPLRARERRQRRHRQQGAARRGRPDALRGRREGRPRPLLRGRRRRRDPDPAAAARVAGRRHGHPGARHRQRHHQLHPRQDGHLRRRLRRGARGGPGARLRRGRPDRRRRGVRRRRQGRDPGLARLPLPGHRLRRAPRGHLRGDRRRRPVGQGHGLGGQAARHLRARGRGTTRSPSACTRR